MRRLLRRLWREEEGVTAIEYGLMAGLIVLAIVASVTALGDAVGTMYVNIAAAFPG